MGLSRVAVLERLSDSVMTKMKQFEKGHLTVIRQN